MAKKKVKGDSDWIQVRVTPESRAAKMKLLKAGYNLSALLNAFVIAKAKEV